MVAAILFWSNHTLAEPLQSIRAPIVLPQKYNFDVVPTPIRLQKKDCNLDSWLLLSWRVYSAALP